MSNARIERVAVGTDGSDTASRAVDFALDLAERCGSDLVVASSFRPVDERRIRLEQEDAPADFRWSINPTEDVEAVLRDVEDRAKERGVRVTSEARTGDPADMLCSVVEDHDIDVLVVGSKGMHRRHLPSIPNAVSHKAQCSVLIVKTV